MKKTRLIMDWFLKNEEKAIKEIVAAIKQEIENASVQGAVIGLSGGIDSAAVAYLTALAIGKENVTLVHLPEKELSKNHTDDAKLIAHQLDIELKILEISNPLNEISIILPQVNEDKMAKGNLKARIRAVFLYSIANLENKLVIGTSNKSELAIGYGTKFGDLAADMWPIGDLYKTELYEICKELGIDKKIIEKPPTAGLWENQTDEEEIGVSYEKLDKFLIGLENQIEEEKLTEDLELSSAQVDRIKNLVMKNKHKGVMPKICKMDRN
ncbi:MAG: NAD+ synthase [Candidatus Heimdallarchaeaceae archaeon]